MGQRLGIAAALLGDPRVLILDEPVNGLDPEGIVWIRNLMKHLAAEGRTVFVSSHLMNEMAITADHLIVIGRGRLIADCSTEEFIERSTEQVVRGPHPGHRRGWPTLLAEGGGAKVARRRRRPAVSPAWPRRASASSRPRAASSCTSSRPPRASLEEAFMELTAGQRRVRRRRPCPIRRRPARQGARSGGA